MTNCERELVAMIEAILKNHCSNERLFCSTCTDARALVQSIKHSTLDGDCNDESAPHV